MKPFVLLFDAYYKKLYKISKVEERTRVARLFVFMGTSFSAKIADIALRYVISNGAMIHEVDSEQLEFALQNVRYFPMRAADYVASKTA